MKKLLLILSFLLMGNFYLLAQEIDSTSSVKIPIEQSRVFNKYLELAVLRTYCNFINIGWALPNISGDINGQIENRHGFTIGTSIVLPLFAPKIHPIDSNREQTQSSNISFASLIAIPGLKISFNYSHYKMDVFNFDANSSFRQTAKRIEIAPTLSWCIVYAGPYFAKNFKITSANSQNFSTSNYFPQKDYGFKFGVRLFAFDIEYYWGLKDYLIENNFMNIPTNHNVRTRMLNLKFEW